MSVVRRATVADAAVIATVHIASSEEAYAPLAAAWPQPDRAKREAMWSATLRDKPGLLLVAEEHDAIVGFLHGGSARRTEPGPALEVYAIHVLPTERGRGTGGALWSAARAELAGALYVDTLAELRCCSFYEARGGTRIESRPVAFHGATRTHVTYRFD